MTTRTVVLLALGVVLGLVMVFVGNYLSVPESTFDWSDGYEQRQQERSVDLMRRVQEAQERGDEEEAKELHAEQQQLVKEWMEHVKRQRREVKRW